MGHLNVNLTEGSAFWIVPLGTPSECGKCDACFHVSLSETSFGDVTSELGYGFWADSNASDFNETSVKENGDVDVGELEMSEEYLVYSPSDANTSMVKLLNHHWSNRTDITTLVIGEEAVPDATLASAGNLRGSWHPGHGPWHPGGHPHPWNPARNHRRRVCRNICRYFTYRPGFRRRQCKMQCRWGGWR